MKIVNVTPGLIPIPPNGWGAVEKIIWEQHLNLEKQGYDSSIRYLREVPNDADIVHIHIANLALEAHELGIPYYFTMHDHHTVYYGKDTHVYKTNLQAMQHAIKSFVPAKYLVDYFEGIPMYVSHGVNSDHFSPGKVNMNGSVKYITKTVQQHKLLCVANNGYILNNAEDRKGFSYAINAAKKLNLPITIAGPSNNKKYFEQNPVDYDNITILYDLTEEELLRVYREHSIFVSPSELEAGHPNLTLLEALSCGLPVVSTFESLDAPKGIIVIERNDDSVTRGIQEAIQKYDYYSYLARKQAEALDWSHITTKLVDVYKQSKTEQHMGKLGKELLSQYESTKVLGKSPRKPPTASEPTINYHNIDGMSVDITGGPSTQYKVSFIDKRSNEEVYGVVLSTNSWAKTAVKYYVDWKIVIEDTQSSKRYEYNLDLTGKRVYIALDSKSMGDTLAWIPYVEEFRQKHKCEVVCSTFWNFWFEKVYPEIKFVNPGDQVTNIFAQYCVGLFYNDNRIDFNKHPINPMPYALQKYASDILGLDFTEIKPRIHINSVPKKEKQVTLGFHSTAQTKYWNNPTGWQEVVDWLRSEGYTVKLLSKEENGYMGNTHPTGVVYAKDSKIETTVEELQKSEFFIGIGSGLTWLSWALNVPTVLISGFSDPISEMQECIRISAPPRACSSCWNRHTFDRGDWNWCPDLKGTQRQFECTKLITGKMVIDELKMKLVKKPKIQIKHLLTRPTDEREIISMHSIKQLQQYGMDYEARINEVYDGLAPQEFCRRPHDVSTTPQAYTHEVGLGTLTGRHYGCYLAHRNALMSIDEKYDYTLIFEADAYLTTSTEEFVDAVQKAIVTAERDGVYYISFGNNYSDIMRPVDDTFYETAHYQNLAHCYLVVNRHKQWWMDRIKDSEWDVADLWLNHVFCHHPQKRYTTRKAFSRQVEGLSLIDNKFKLSGDIV